MKSSSLAGIGLGLVAAVVFASAATGPLFVRFLLLFITPLAIALAGLGWGWRTALIAGLGGSAFMLAFGGAAVAVAFGLTQAVPMVVLTYLALLSRPGDEGGIVADDGGPALEWYPVGRLILWAGGLAGLMSVGSLMLLGGDLEALRKMLAEFMQSTVAASLPGEDGAKLSEAEIAALSEVALSVLPAASTLSWMTSLLFNLWLAGRVTVASGQLGRPWPDLAAVQYPPGTPLVFGVLLLATMFADYAGLAASAFAGGLFVAYLLLGLAVAHWVTRGQPWRPFVLWALYVTLIIMNLWVAILIVMLGLAEGVLQIRARYPGSGPGGPPATLNS